MKIGILGYGKEGKSAEKYFSAKGADITIFDNFTETTLQDLPLKDFDLILRSPSVHPRPGFSSVTRYFFEHCPCPIIGVTGTKGKGTTCSIITDLLKNLNQKVHLVGNIGNPAIDILDQLTPENIVVYEMSSFQLWDLENSPHIAIVLTVEPDHLNVHDNYTDYINAKTNITKHQAASDFCIYYKENPDSAKIAQQSPAQKFPYPINDKELLATVKHLAIPGRHNQENAEAALLAVASYFNLPLSDFLNQHHQTIIKTLEHFQGLPHRLQFLRELNGVKYYDDNFSTTPTSLRVALEAFPDQKLVLIAGGRDKTNYQDLPEIADLIKNSPNLQTTILIGESGRELAKILPTFKLADSLESAVKLAKSKAEQLSAEVVLMSPAAASFDMFESVYERGAKFQNLIQSLR